MRSYLPKRRTIKDLFYSEGFFLQEEVYSCGPTTIQNLQVFFGMEVTPIEKMLKLTKTCSKNGTEHTGILEALDSLNIKHSEEKNNSDIAGLEGALDKNCVCIVNYYNAFNEVGHFSLMIDHDDQAFYLIDSSLGFLRLRKKHFEKRWHNSDKTLDRWFVSICSDQVEFKK